MTEAAQKKSEDKAPHVEMPEGEEIIVDYDDNITEEVKHPTLGAVAQVKQ